MSSKKEKKKKKKGCASGRRSRRRRIHDVVVVTFASLSVVNFLVSFFVHTWKTASKSGSPTGLLVAGSLWDCGEWRRSTWWMWMMKINSTQSQPQQRDFWSDNTRNKKLSSLIHLPSQRNSSVRAGCWKVAAAKVTQNVRSRENERQTLQVLGSTWLNISWSKFDNDLLQK